MRRTTRNRSRRRRGLTTLELLVASTLTSLILFGAVGTLLTSMTSWYRGAGKIAAESGAQQAVRTVSSELRAAMQVEIDTDGQGLTYRLPLLDENGDCALPAQWDGVERRIELDLGAQPPALLMGAASGDMRVICRDVIARDPYRTGGEYRLFTPGEGATVRQVTVKIATSTIGAGDEETCSRIRETIYLRNVP